MKEQFAVVFSRWTEFSAYILGYLYGDATINIKKNAIAISGTDRDILEEILLLLGIENKISMYGKSAHRVIFSSRRFVDMLMTRGLHPAKALRMRFPVSIPVDLRRHFIRGYFDARGHFNVEKGRRVIALFNGLSYEFIEDLRDELVTAGLTRVEVRTPSGGRAQLKYYVQDTRKLYEYMYKDARIYSRKKRSRYENNS